MEIQTEYASPLRLQKLLIEESSFKRSEDSLRDIRVDVNISSNVEDAGIDTYKVTLELSMNGENDKLNIFVKCVAYFNTAPNNIALIEKNTLAIMFPYVRSYVSNITAQPGMMPIVLPPMNIAAMMKNKES